MKAPATYAHFLTFNAASLLSGNWFKGLCAGLTVLLIILYRVYWLPVCGIHPGYVNTGVVYYIILLVDRTNYNIHSVNNLLHAMLDDNDYYMDLILLCTTKLLACI